MQFGVFSIKNKVGIMKKSTYYFIGSISDKSSGFQVQDVKLKDGIEFSVFLDGIVVKKTSDDSFDILRNGIKNSVEILISTVVLQTKKSLTFSWQSWVEAKETEVLKDVIGWFGISEVQFKNLKTQRSPINTSWKKAAQFYNLLSKGNENHILAIKDFRAAIADTGPDSFLFAYRAVEDICRSITGKDPQDSWKKMHSTLQTSENFIKPLTNVSECVRHGDINNDIVKNANRDNLLEVSRKIILLEFKRTFKLDLN